MLEISSLPPWLPKIPNNFTIFYLYVIGTINSLISQSTKVLWVVLILTLDLSHNFLDNLAILYAQ